MFLGSNKSIGMEGYHAIGIHLYYKEWCLEHSIETEGEVGCEFQVAIQDQAHCIWLHREVQVKVCGESVF
jgi:hypothetical protein